MMRINVAAVLLVIGCTGFAAAAPKSLLGRFLASSLDDSLILARQGHVELLKKTPSSIPLIGDAEFRVKNRAFDFSAQRYTLKLSPRGFGETKALRDYKRAQINYEETLSRYDLNELLLKRYVFFIDILERKSLSNGYRELIPVYEDRIKVMEQLKASTDFDLTVLISTEKDLAKMISENIEEMQEVTTANRYIWAILGDTLAGGIDTAGLISVAAVNKIIENMTFSLDETNIYLKNVKSEFDFSEKRYNVELARNRNIISFFDFSFDFGAYNDETMRYREGKSYDQNLAYVMDIGIKLPFISGSREDIVRRKIDFLNDKEESIRLHNELIAKLHKDQADMQAYVERYALLTARETETDAAASLKKYQQLSGANPLVLLEIKEDLIKNRMEKEKIHFSILRNFIYLLDGTGQLIREPVVNFLSAGREALKQ